MSRVVSAVAAGATDTAAVRGLLDALLGSASNAMDDGATGRALAARLLKRCPSRAAFAAEALQAHFESVRTFRAYSTDSYDAALRALTRVRPAWLPANAAALVQRNPLLIHVPAIANALLRHDPAAILPSLTGAAAVPDPDAALSGLEIRILPVAAPPLARLPPPQQAAVAAHCARVLRDPLDELSKREVREARRTALAQLVALPDAPLAQLRAAMAEDARDEATRDAVINAMHAHPAIHSLLSDLRVRPRAALCCG